MKKQAERKKEKEKWIKVWRNKQKERKKEMLIKDISKN